MIHGHEVLEMVSGNVYTEEQLINAINDKFGESERFYTCSASDLTAKELIEFLKGRGKITETEGGLTSSFVHGSCGHK